MTSTSFERWVIPRHLTIASIDAWLALPTTWRDPALHLGAKGCTADPGAAAYLQSALCMLLRSGLQPRLSVPASTLQGLRAETAFGPSYDGFAVTPAEKVLAASIEGLVLGQLCVIENADDLTTERLRALQRDALESSNSVYGRGTGKSVAVLTVGDDRDPEDKSELYDRIQAFEGALTGLLQSLESKAQPLTSPWFEHLSSYGFESTENTFDHARFDLNRAVIPSVRMLSVLRHSPHEVRSRLDLASRRDSSVATYLERLEAQYARLGLDFRHCTLIEVTVADGGVGVAATMAGSMDVYTNEDPSFEKKALAAAYIPRGTGKPSGAVGMGHGLKKMLNATYRLSGHYAMMTGRFELARTFIDPQGRPEPHDFDNDRDPAFDIRDHAWTRAMLLAGTTCTLLFPFDDAMVLSDPRERRGSTLASHGR